MPIYYSIRLDISIQTLIFVIVTISGVIFDSSLLINCVYVDILKFLTFMIRKFHFKLQWNIYFP